MTDDENDRGCAQSNWSETITFTSTICSEPASVADLQKVLKDAQQAGLQVRPRGSGHSWNDAIVTSDVSVNTNKFVPPNMPVTQKFVTIDGQQYCLLSVPAGMNQGEFSLLAQRSGCPLPSQGPAPDITLSGFTANGCHGTGWNQPTIAELVYGFVLLGPGGEELVFDPTQMPKSLQGLGISAPDMMNIVRVHLGALGVLSQITFKLPMSRFNILARNQFVPITDVLDRNDWSKLKLLVEKHDYIELFWFPYNNWAWSDFPWRPTPAGPEKDTLWVMIFDQTNAPVNADERLIELWNDALGWFGEVGQLNGYVIASYPNSVPIYSSLALAAVKAKNFFNDGVVFPPRNAFLYQKSYFRGFNDLEFTIPMDGDKGFADVVEGFYQLVDRMEAWRKGESGHMPYPINLSVHLRFIKNSQAALSPAFQPAGSSTHTCYIEYLSYAHESLTDTYNAFGQDFFSTANGLGWKKFDGIPNWGKALSSVPDIFSYVHGILSRAPPGGGESRLQKFLKVRDIIDPGGKTFSNPYLQGFFTGEAPAAQQHAVTRAAARHLAFAASPPPETRSFDLSPVAYERLPRIAAPARKELSRGIVEFTYDVGHGAAYLVNEHHEINVLAARYDAAAQRITYTTSSPSQFLTPAEILDRVRQFH